MKKHLLRTLFVALMVMIGANAWADNYFTQDYEGDGVTADWTSGNTGRYTVDMKVTEDPANTFLTVNAVSNGNNGTTITSTSVAGKVANDKDFTMEFDLQITNGNNQASSFYIYDSANDAAKAFFALVAPSTGTKWNIQGSADHQVDLAKNTWYTFKIAKSAGITYLTLTNKATGDKLKDQSIIPTLSEAGGLGNMVFNTKRYYAYMAIDNVVVRDVESTDAPASTPTTYTLKYVDGNGTALKEDVIINTIVGIGVTASSDQIADFKIGEGDNQKKWIYVSGNTSITTVETAESNVITLVFREAEKFNYTFTAKSGDILLETYPIATGFELDNIKVPYHHYYFTDGKIYQKGATSSEYNYSFVLDSNNKEVGINDYAILEKDNVIFFAEAENLKALTPITDGLQASRNSFAAGAFASEYVPFITLAPGTYTLTAAGYGGTYSFMNGETSVLNMEQAGYWREITSEEFTLETSTDITFKGGVGATGALDYIYIQSTNGSAKEYEKPFDPATVIVNADFTADEPIAQKVCTYAKDVQEGQVAQMQPLTGWTIVENGDARAAGTFAYGSTAILGGDGGNVPATGPNGETEGKVLGLEAVWSATTQYTQEVTLPAGEYLFEAVIYNAAGTGALSQNLIGIDGTYCTTKSYPVGKWTKDQVKITLAEEKTVIVSLGVNSGNVGNGAAPHLFIDHVKLYGSEEIAAIELAAAKENALAEVDALTIGDVLFTYPEDAISSAKAAIESATTVEAVDAAVVNAKAALNKPAEDKAYAITNTTAEGNLCITTEKVSVAKDASVFFTAVEGGYILSNEAGEYIFKTAGNTWTLSTTTTKEEAYVVNFNLADGAYTIQGANGLFGLDNTEEGSIVYANKAQSNNGLWTIAEYVAPVKTDYTDYIVNADLKGEGGFDAAGTKGFDGSGIVKVGNAAEFDFKQTINLPSGYYRMTAQAAYRYGADEAAEAAAITEGTATKLLKMYVKIGDKEFSVPVQNRYDGASETDFANGDGSVTVNEKFVPNSSNAVKAWFAAGKYVNEVIFNLPADGDVTIGINRIATPESDYTVIGPWTLTRLGDAEVEPEPEPIEGIIYSWESPEGTPVEFGGTIAYVNGDGDRLNYKNGDYYTICLNGKKANIDDETASANAGKMVITLDEALNSGDTIVYTAYINKNTSATAAAYILFENGAEANGADFSDAANINEAFGGTPQNDTIIVSEAAAGSKTITLTRGKTGTNLFITKLQIIEKKAEPEPEPTPEPGTDMTAKIVNPSFETGNLDGWTVGNSADTGVKENSNATYATEGCDGNYLFNTWWQGIPITQTVKDLSNGLYELKALMTNDAITAGNQPCLYLLANGGHSEAFSSENAGKFAEGSIQFYVLDGTATIGAVGGNADGSFNADGYYWYKVDNFRLTYLAPLPNIDDVVIPEGKMSVTAANAITSAKEAGDVIALMTAVENAKASIEAYTHMKKVLDDMAAITEATNVYTAEAKTAYDEAVAAAQKGYDEGTVSDADAAAFNYGSRLNGTIPTLLLSAWTAKATGIPYINTWSVEGNNDGTNFFTPFFEYWVTDENSLAADTLTATLSGLEAGDYDVTAWVRVRAKNGYEAPATGITLQANDGEAIDVAAGDQVGTSQFYIKEFTATGTVAEDGVLKIKFNVAADNNISWLSFKNVKFEKHITVNPDDPEITVPEGKINLIANGNLAGDDVSSFFAKESPSADIVGARIVPGFGENNSRGIVVKSANEASNADAWNTQFWIKVNQPLESGTKLHVEFDYAASQAAKATTQAHGNPGAYQHWLGIGDVNFTTEWQHFSTDITVDETMAKGDKGEGIGMISIAFNLAEVKTATEYYFDNFGVWAELPAPVDEWTDLIVNGDMEGESLECFYVTEQGFGGPYVAMATEGIGKDGSKAVKVQSADSPAQDWDSQFFIRLPYQLPAGTKFKLSFDYKADKAGDFDTQSHAEPGQYIHWACAGSGSFTTEWQTYEKEGTVPAECDGSENKNEAGEVLFLKTFQTIAFNLAKNKVATEFIFDNIKFEIPADVAKTLTPNPAVNPVYYKDVLGIETVKVAQKADVIYNLRGQKVNKADKGLFIINGKKVVK